ncbi:hypothetical protein O3M35_009927 [Rhynocoris fuscipes]|uniref:Uncharacterized protein n=1 Tax=Rhynocoris fuscipes TaxID=488301 RepID=A0AAW1D8B6_9HEMI
MGGGWGIEDRVRLRDEDEDEEDEHYYNNESVCNLEVNWETRLACMNEGGVDPVLLVTSASTHHNPIAITFIVLLVSIVICTSGFVIWKKWPTIQLMSCRRFRYTQDDNDDESEL